VCWSLTDTITLPTSHLGRSCRLIWLLQSGSLLVFSICWVAVLDYLVFMFECSWGHGNSHMHWPELGESSQEKGPCCDCCLPARLARVQPSCVGLQLSVDVCGHLRAECIKMPHLANMVFGMAVALLTVVIVACLVSTAVQLTLRLHNSWALTAQQQQQDGWHSARCLDPASQGSSGSKACRV
jgi:hypothetical protein